MLLIGSRLAIKGDWDTIPTPIGRVEVLLKPSRHIREGNPYVPYTRAMLEALDSLVSTDDVVEDFGAGNGILSLAAIKLGARVVWAYEMFQWKADLTIEHAILNGVSKEINVLVSDFTQITFMPTTDVIVVDLSHLATLKASLVQATHSLRSGGAILTMPIIQDVLELDAASGSDLILESQVAVTGGFSLAIFRRN